MTDNAYGASFWSDENVLELDRGVVAQHCECINAPELSALKWLILF